MFRISSGGLFSGELIFFFLGGGGVGGLLPEFYDKITSEHSLKMVSTTPRKNPLVTSGLKEESR